MNNRAKKIKNLVPDWTVKNQFFDLRVCPDCMTLQLKKPMVEGSKCDNPECDTYVGVYTGYGKEKDMLMWYNENWD